MTGREWIALLVPFVLIVGAFWLIMWIIARRQRRYGTPPISTVRVALVGGGVVVVMLLLFGAERLIR